MTTQQTKGKDVLDSASNLGEGKDDLDAYTASDVNNINQKIAPAYSLESNQKSKLPLPKDNANEQQYNDEKDEEEENEEQKADFKLKLLKLEKELEDSKENAFNLEKTRRNSVTKVSQTMFHKLLVAEQTKKQIKVTYEEKIKELEEKLAIERLKTETTHSEKEMNSMELKKYKLESEQLKQQVSQIKNKSETKEKQRRESFTQLQNSYWTKLLQAEDDSAQQIKKLKHEIINLQNQITNRKKTIEWLTTSKLNLITECNRQMNDLRAAVTVYNKNENNNSWF
eukprot:77703_1